MDLGGSEALQQSGQHLRHYYVDVSNREDNNVESNDQHISIDPQFRAEFQEGNISEFLRLPELIPTKKRRKQLPLLDYTQSQILTSEDYIRGLEEVLAKKEAVVAVAKKRKEDKEATKEQRKLEKKQQQREKERRARERANKKIEKQREQQSRPGRDRRGRVEPP